MAMVLTGFEMPNTRFHRFIQFSSKFTKTYVKIYSTKSYEKSP